MSDAGLPATPPTPTDPPAPKRRRSWRRRLVTYASLYLVWVLVVIAGCADWLIIHPSRNPIPTSGATRLDVPTSGGKTLEVWTARADVPAAGEPDAFLLVFVGNADRAERGVFYGVDQVHGRKVEVWSMNYPGYGGSTGPARLKAIGPAALAAFDALKARAGTRPVFVSGGSLGNTAALHVGANRPVAGLILTNPPPLRQLILQRHGWWNLWLIATPVALQIPAALDTIANARRCTAPAVFVLAGRDSIVPPKYQEMVVAAYAGEKRFVRMADADHNIAPEGEAAVQAAREIEWLFSRTIPNVPPDPAAPATRPAP